MVSATNHIFTKNNHHASNNFLNHSIYDAAANHHFDFSKENNTYEWRVVDDGVMGGRSEGTFAISENRTALFTGDVSLENNGGFSSIRYGFNEKNLADCEKFTLRIKGDGKNYQFRAKKNYRDYHSYVYSFETTGAWQTIEVPFDKMIPSFRGRVVDIAGFKGESLQEIGFLIGNKKEQSFRLEIEKIEAE